jgi:hypothetical protein
MPPSKRRGQLQVLADTKKTRTGHDDAEANAGIQNAENHDDDDDSHSTLTENNPPLIDDDTNIDSDLESVESHIPIGLENWPIDLTIKRKVLAIELNSLNTFNNDMVKYLLNSGIWLKCRFNIKNFNLYKENNVNRKFSFILKSNEIPLTLSEQHKIIIIIHLIEKMMNAVEQSDGFYTDKYQMNTVKIVC